MSRVVKLWLSISRDVKKFAEIKGHAVANRTQQAYGVVQGVLEGLD